MKASLFLFVTALALMVLGCGGKVDNENPQENHPQAVENDTANQGDHYTGESEPQSYTYVEPEENIVRKAAELLLLEDYIDGLKCQSKTIATVDVDLDETETIACYQCLDGSWVVLTYSPIHGPEDDYLCIYSLDGDGNLSTGDAQNLSLSVEGMQLSGHQLFFPYQGDELQFGKDYFIFPVEDKQPLRLEWTGAQFVVKE